MELPLKSSAMTPFLFQILVFYTETIYTSVPDADQVAKDPKVSQQWQKTLSLPSTRYHNATLHLKN